MPLTIDKKPSAAKNGTKADYVPSPRLQKATRDRTSQAIGQALFAKGGLGYILRRGVDSGTFIGLQSVEGIARLAVSQPFTLLSLLPDIVPEVGLALWNGQMLGCGPDSIRMKAMTAPEDGGGVEAPDGTAAIKALWDNQPDEVGNLIDAIGQNYEMVMFGGMAACEAVPGPRGTGLAAVWPVNTLTLRFRREDDGFLNLYQRQVADPNGIGVYSAGMAGVFIPMPLGRFFWSKLSALPDDPYGRAPFASALTTVIECIGFIRDFTLAFHRIGAPKWDIGFDFEMWTKIAKEVVGLTDPKEINEYVQQKFTEAVAFFNDLNADDAFFHDKNSTVNATGAGDKWPDIPALWSMLRLRLIQALKHLPTLMGVVEGSTETWSTVEWKIFTQGLITIIRKAVEPLRRAAQLHLQLLGMPYIVELEMQPIRDSQRLVDAQAEQIEIANAAAKRDEGWYTQDQASMDITETAAVGEPRSWQLQAQQQANLEKQMGQQGGAQEDKGAEPRRTKEQAV